MRRASTSIGTDPISWPIWKPGYLAWSLAALSIIIALISFAAAVRLAVIIGDFQSFLSHQALTPFLTIAFTLVGALIASRVPRNIIGWIFLAVGVFYTLSSVGVVFQVYESLAPEGYIFPGTDLVTW
jgi:hypothetical protein